MTTNILQNNNNQRSIVPETTGIYEGISPEISKNTSQKIQTIFEENIFSKNHIIEQLDWEISQIKNNEIKKCFIEQCQIIQEKISQEKIKKIPSELVILLITHEWKRVHKMLLQDRYQATNELATTVIHQLEKSIPQTQNHHISFPIDPLPNQTTHGLQYHIIYRANEGILQLGFIENIQELHRDILLILKQNISIQKIEFPMETPTHIKRLLMDILSENRPLLGVLRIAPEGRVGTYFIRGVKYVNDTLSQQIADQLIASIKEYLIMFMSERYGIGKTVRISASYNKITLALPKDTDIPLPTQIEIDNLVKIAILAKNDVLEECVEQFHTSKFEVQKAIEEIRVTCGASKVSPNGGDLAKLEAVYESEIQARGGSIGTTNIKRIKNIYEREIAFVNEFKNMRFRYGNYNYPAIILDIQGKLRPHPLLIEIIRKPGGIEFIKPERLGGQVKNFLNILNREFDYIAPALDFQLGFQEVRKIDMEFRSGSISRKSFETTYKNSLSKTAFFGEIEGKKGVCVMIDIKGMFIKNYNAYVKLTSKMAYSEKYIPLLERLDVLGDITRTFIRGTEQIMDYYPNILCTHGGDEFMFFIENAQEDKIHDIIEQAKGALGDVGFDIRAAARVDIGSKEIFDALDGETKIAKAIEVIGRMPNGYTPHFLRHIEVSASSFSPDYIVSELYRRRKYIEHTLFNWDTEKQNLFIIELRGIQIQIEKIGDNSIKIHALPLESHPT